MVTLPSNPLLTGQARMIPDVRYSSADGGLGGVLLTPWDDDTPHPAIVFVQGSAWTRPDVYAQLPQLSGFARAGYTVFTITHRSAEAGHPFPAFLQDVKCAVRYLRASCGRYGIDADRIGIFGTSSGGNAALLTAMTADDPRYRTEEYAEYSDGVQCAISCFGPTWIEGMMPAQVQLPKLAYALCGNRPYEDVAREMSPYCIAEKGRAYPPMLMIHGDKDVIVPFSQSALLAEKLENLSQDVQLVRIEGAPHEGSFWSQAVYDRVMAFMNEKLSFSR